MATIENWRGDPVEISRSPSGVILFNDYSDNLIRSTDVAWPPPALVSKLVADDRVFGRWPHDTTGPVSRTLGYYTRLQSINSEDVVTWSYFGPLKYGAPAVRVSFLNWLAAQVGLASENEVATIDLWRRIPHPLKPSAPGPELDAIIHGDRTVAFVEAKWSSPQGVGQGPDGTATQMELRRDFLERFGHRIYGERQFLVIGLVVSDPIEKVTPDDSRHVATRTITWVQLAAFPGHPAAEEFRQYIHWKLRVTGHLPRPS